MINKGILSFLAGSIVLCTFATFQKKAIGAPLVIEGYFVPFIFGGVAGLLIGFWVNKLQLSRQEYKNLNRHLEKIVEERTQNIQEINSELKRALNEVKTLQGILPICAKCKKIRDSDGYWNQVECYIEKNTDAQFSHGLCGECSDELYGDKDWYKGAGLLTPKS